MPPPTSLRRVALLAIVVVLTGATAFGLWHLLVGGFVNGNPRAATFGFLWAAIAGAFLGGLLLGLRRFRPS